jgi:hypothetical protein
MPTRDHDGLLWFDSYLKLLAPFFGDVVSLPSMEALYRLHSLNSIWRPDFAPAVFEAVSSERMCHQDLLRTALIDATLMRTKGTSLAASGINVQHHLFHMTNRLIARRFRPDTYPLAESLPTVWRKYLVSLWRSGCSLRSKVLHAGWATATAFAPRNLAVWACRKRAARERIEMVLPPGFDVRVAKRRLASAQAH